MNSSITYHCIAWQAGAPLLQEIRMAACRTGLIDEAEALPDEMDAQCRHALALSACGKIIGCARLMSSGRVDRMVVLPHEHQARIEAAMSEVLRDYAAQIQSANSSFALRRANRSQVVLRPETFA
jgi:hypothetical protein